MCTGWFCREQGSCDKVKSSGVFFVGGIRLGKELIRKKSPDFLLLPCGGLLYTDSARLVKIIEIQRRIEI